MRSRTGASRCSGRSQNLVMLIPKIYTYHQASYAGPSLFQPSNVVYSSLSSLMFLNSRACRETMSAYATRSVYPGERRLTLIARYFRSSSLSEPAKSIMTLLLHSAQNKCGLRFCPKKYFLSLDWESPRNSTSPRFG